MAVRASRTSSSWNGLMIAITIFMGPIPAWARSRRDRAFSTEVHHAEKVTTRAQPAPIESDLNGLMIAITIFMGPIPAWARSRRDRAFSTEVHHAEKVTTRAQPAPIE